MPDIISGLTCPNCSGTLDVREGQRILKCPYCDARSLVNPAFFAKMIMLLIVAGLTAVLQRPLTANPGYWDASGGRVVTAKGIAVISLVLWSCIVFAGRWIAYVTAL